MFAEIKGILKHSVVYLAGTLASRMVGFVMIPVYTHYLTTEEYGTLELLDLTSYLIGLLLAMGVAQSVVRLYHDYDDQVRQNRVVSVAMITLWVASAFSAIWLLLFARDISQLVFKSPDYLQLFHLIFVTMILNLNIEIPMNLLLIRERSVLYNVINLVRLAINLSLNIIFIVYLGMGVKGILLGGLLTSAVTGVFLTIFTIRQIGLSFSRQTFFDMLKYGTPLIGSWLGMFIVNFGDRFILQRFASLSDVGIYSLAYKFGMLPNFLVLTPFMLIWGPKRFEIARLDDAKRTYSYVFTYFLFVQLFIGLGVSVLIKDVVSIVADSEYHSAYMYVPMIILSYVLWGCYSYAQLGMLLEKKTKYLAYASGIGAAVNVGANLLLIPELKLWGASIATLITFGVIFCFVYNRSQKLYNIPYQLARIAKMTFCAFGLLAIASIIDISNVFLSIVTKFSLACCFPVVLYFLRFYTATELAKMREGVHRIKILTTESVLPRIPLINRLIGKGRR
ncbi:MAG: oligosaccharide flippase family protein [candidate division Zixibacteria bacterium]|nr:oligosaccharide flippase family protein [candidate division Zixibacteria bacterium]MBU1471135.1 oligosaccharide flippase family protein [candidate division Zixibacteria bacterium]MBU2626651.1 oligosaccharide flippase family protein [candidate division Zixibacteria bacterium]